MLILYYYETYIIDELKSGEYEKIRTYLDENVDTAKVDVIY